MKMLSKLKDYFFKPEPPHVWVAFEKMKEEQRIENEYIHGQIGFKTKEVLQIWDFLRGLLKQINDFEQKVKDVQEDSNSLDRHVSDLCSQIKKIEASLKPKKDTKPVKEKPKPRKSKKVAE